jgi:hypothetical protein
LPPQSICRYKAATVIDTTYNPELPAPFWFIQFFKVLGFTLHAAPMGLWYAGVVLAMLWAARGKQHARRFAARLMTQMPVIIAYGVNFGIVPLLFVQVAYAKVFYPATILMAWFWLAIIALLIPAYYGVYLYTSGMASRSWPTRWQLAGGWTAAVFFILIGFIFANGFSLMANVAGWSDLWLRHNVAGAALGTALNTADAMLWPRWLLMFGLALGTTAAWIYFDAAWLAGRESEEYRRWAAAVAWRLATVGALWFAVSGDWYVFGTWPEAVRREMFSGPLIVLTLATGASPWLLALLLFLGRERRDQQSRGWACVALAVQLGVLAINALSRHLVQRLSLRPYFDPAAAPENVQIGPLVAFLVLFALGVGTIIWMIAQVIRARSAEGT